MKKKQMKASLLLVSLLTAGFLVTGCTNDDYDFDRLMLQWDLVVVNWKYLPVLP